MWIFVLVLTYVVHLVFVQPEFLGDGEYLHLIATPVSSLVLFYSLCPILKAISSSFGMKTGDSTQLAVFSNVVTFGFVCLGLMFVVVAFTADLLPTALDFRS